MSDLTNLLAHNRQHIQSLIGDSLTRNLGAVWAATDPSDAGLVGFRDGATEAVNVHRRMVARASLASLQLWAASAGATARIDADVDRAAVAASSVDRWAPAPVVRLRKLLSDGMDYDAAHGEAGRYADTLGSLEVAWADLQTLQSVQSVADAAGIRWRRVTGPSPCNFCFTISLKQYRNVNEIRVHANCRCTLAPYHPDVDGLFKDLPRHKPRAA